MIDMTDSAVEQIKKAHTQANGAPPEGGKPKIVLRIALQRLRWHYDDNADADRNMIG